MTERRYVVADVFTDRALEGNPVAVFLDGGGLETVVMQRLAREINLSETVFVTEGVADGGAPTPIRIFTPGAELPFAGHPVLGTAFILAEGTDVDTVTLAPPIGPVPIALRREGGRVVYGEMDQPIPEEVEFDRVDALLRALGVADSRLPVVSYTNGPTFVYVAIDSEEQLSSLRPDMNALADLGGTGVSCYAGSPPRVRVRMFGPAAGVPEDPATGSAAGPLAVHLVRCGLLDFGEELEIRQGVEIGRPSLLRARVEGTSSQIDRVVVGGSAVIVARGTFTLP
jgi:trans-2,3-dihydro-3-hydroxyanthranilate isomerase